MIDIVGMGGSTRPTNFDKREMTPEKTIEYFNGYMEQWRQSVNIKDFYLVGHSFGGYLVGNYAVKYH